MSLRSIVRGPAQLAAKAAIPFLELGESGASGRMRAAIRSARSRAVAEPKVDRWRFRSGEMPGFTPANIVRVLSRTRTMKDQIERAFSLLADDRSRDILAALVEFRALGPRHVELPVDVDRKLQYYSEAAKRQLPDLAEPFPPYSMHLFNMGGLKVECWLGNVVASFFEKQYFFERNGVAIRPEPGDTVIDAGACFGDTALSFAQAVGKRGRVHSFEPMPRQMKVLKRNLERNPALAERVEVHPCAAFDSSGKTLRFADVGVAARVSNEGEVAVRTITIDDFVRDRAVQPTYIKMDIEGAESLALKGARETLQGFRPKLGISIYHSFEDLFGIIAQIHEIEPGYRFFIDHHTIYNEETVLYARGI